MQKLSDKVEQIEQCQAVIDELSVNLHAVIDSGTKAAKTLVTIWLESLAATASSQNGAEFSTPGDRLMTLDELAVYVGYGKRAIQKWIEKGGLPDRRAMVGADPRFDKSEVDEWMKRHRKKPRSNTVASGTLSPLQRDCKRGRSKNNVSL